MSKEFEDINLEDYENIEVEMDDIKKAKMKKVLRAKVMENNKRNKKKIVIAASLSVIMTLGIVSQPAIAQSIPLFNTAYEALGFKQSYLPVANYIGQSVESKGTKVTIENITGTENKIKVSLKIESENEDFIKDEFGVILGATFNGVQSTGGSTDSVIIDKNTKLSVVTVNSIQNMPENGRLKIKAMNEKYDFNETFKLDVNFSESFSKIIRKDIETETEIQGVNIYSLKASTIGSVLEVSSESFDKVNSNLYLKVDGKIYASNSYFGDKDKGYLEYEELLYDDIVNAKDVSVIKYTYNGPVENIIVDENYNMELEDKKRHEETREVREENERIYSEAEKETMNDVTYVKEINYINGGKAEIYNCERENGLVNIYIKGATKKEALILASHIGLYTGGGNTFMTADKNKIIETEDGYIVEFKDSLQGKINLLGDHPVQFGTNIEIFGDEVKLILK